MILEDRVRYVGEPVAIVAGYSEGAAERACSLIHVEYEVQPHVLLPEDAIDGKIIIHPEDDYMDNNYLGNQRMRNIVSHVEVGVGEIEQTFRSCDVILENSYETKANAHVMMETYRSSCTLDPENRLVVTSSTQIPFHARRIIARALGISEAGVRVIKPRVGGGFGGKQTVVTEVINAFVTLKTGHASKLILTRRETFVGTNSRHQMKIGVKMGAMHDGTIRAMDIRVISNAGAYGEHAINTSQMTVWKSLPLYAKLEAYHYEIDAVYTNTMPGGAFRGFGATQGIFAVESMANALADALDLDPTELRLKNIPHRGETVSSYYVEPKPFGSCEIERCIRRGREMIGWDWRNQRRVLPDGRIEALGMSLSMQGSGIDGQDSSHVTVTLSERGTYTLSAGATDIGTGCDTVLAQIASQALDCDIHNIAVTTLDTDYTPFDNGSSASRSTYLSGMATYKACRRVRDMIVEAGARYLELPILQTAFDGKFVYDIENERVRISLESVAQQLVVGPQSRWITATGSFGSTLSPPPFAAGFAKIRLDPNTGKIQVVDFVLAVDSGTILNPALATVQAQGGVVQGIGMALYEDIKYTPQGKMMNSTMLQYKIPTRMDVPHIRVAFVDSYEPSGPYGAKSIGEVVINAVPPAIAAAVKCATGATFHTLPILPQDVLTILLNGPQ